MLKVKILLNKNDEEDYCNPCLLVTDDTDLEVPIILPEYMDISVAEILTDRLKSTILRDFTTAEAVRERWYVKK